MFFSVTLLPGRLLAREYDPGDSPESIHASESHFSLANLIQVSRVGSLSSLDSVDCLIDDDLGLALISNRLRLSDGLVDPVSALLGRLGLLKDLSGCGELVDRLRGRRARQILVRVEAADRCNVGDIGQLEEVVLLLAELGDAVAVREEARLVLPVLAVLLLCVLLVPVAALLEAELLWHGRQGDTLGQIRERVDELAPLSLVVVEAAAVAELADQVEVFWLSGLDPVLARDRLVVRVDGAERGLAEVLGQGIVGLSELLRAVGKLAVLSERAGAVLREVAAELGLVLLLERVELALVSVEVVVVRLLGQVSEDLLRRVVEIPLPRRVVLLEPALAGAVRELLRASGSRGGVAAPLVGGILITFLLRRLRRLLVTGVLHWREDLLSVGRLLRSGGLGGLARLFLRRAGFRVGLLVGGGHGLK